MSSVSKNGWHVFYREVNEVTYEQTVEIFRKWENHYKNVLPSHFAVVSLIVMMEESFGFSIPSELLENSSLETPEAWFTIWETLQSER